MIQKSLYFNYDIMKTVCFLDTHVYMSETHETQKTVEKVSIHNRIARDRKAAWFGFVSTLHSVSIDMLEESFNERDLIRS
jgi:hypothetical protein